MKSTDEGLAARFTRLFDAFTKLRRRPVWKENVTAAIAVPEVTIGKHGQWHAHLHVLCKGSYIPHALLKAAWYEVTGDSFVVDVQSVHDRAEAARYVAAYIAGGNEVHKWHPEKIREYSDATHGMRMLRTYGACKLEQADDDSEPDTIGPSTHLGNVNWVLRAEELGVEHAGHAADVLSRLGFAFAAVFDRNPPPIALEPIDDRELAYAVEVVEAIESAYPALPDVGDLNSIQRRHFSGPTPQPHPRYQQMAMDVLRGQRYT